jgi:hypothetical protein
MISEEWDTLETFDKKNQPLDAAWVKVLEAFGDATYLRLEATGQWQVLGDAISPCGPDGHPELSFCQERLIVKTAPPGSLIGKFGGSSVDRGSENVFSIGSFCIVALPDKVVGPLFVGVNGALSRPGVSLSQLRLVIAGARPSFGKQS